MKLKKVTQIEQNIYEIIFVSGIFKTYKIKKIYPYVGDWRFLESGINLPYYIGTALHTIVTNLKVGESYLIESGREK